MAHKTLSLDSDHHLREHKGVTSFTGCQCFKDCTCHEDFTPISYHYFTVKNRKSKKRKTTTHNTLDEALERIKFIKSL